jgi:L-methionine (R)-S-oxide reductase
VERQLLLGPFSGKPACQFIRAQQGKGVCADAFVTQKTVIVGDVEAYPGHIACDGETRSEIVLPIVVDGHAIGVLDLDCLARGGFSEEDRAGLESIVKIIVDSCDWHIQ